MDIRITQIDIATKKKITHASKHIFQWKPRRLYNVILTWWLSDSFKQREEIDKYIEVDGTHWIEIHADDIDWADMDEYLLEIYPEYHKRHPQYLRAIILLFFEKNEIIVDKFIDNMYNKK